MKKLAILTDSSTYAKDSIPPQDVYVINLPLTQDGVDLPDLSAEELIQLMKDNPKSQFTSSQPSPGLFLEFFKKLETEYEKLLFISLSSGLSGTYQSSLQAKDLYEGPMEINCFDSKALVCINDILAKTALEMVKENDDIPAIMTELAELRSHMNIELIVSNVENIKRSGRLKGAAAAIVTLAGIKPIINFSKEGLVQPSGKARNLKKAWIHAANTILKDVANVENTTFYVLDFNNEEGRDFVVDYLVNEKNVSRDKIKFYEATALLAMHLGDGAVAIVSNEEM